jgi:hypothetical protein
MVFVPAIAAADRQADEAAIRDVVQMRQQQNKLSDVFAFVFRESALTITEVNVRFLTLKLPWHTCAGQ